MRTHLPPALRSRARKRERAVVEPDKELAIGERRLARLVRELRSDGLVDYLRTLRRCERREARLVLIRELGPRRAGELMAGAFGAGQPVPSHLRPRLVAVLGEVADAARLHHDEDGLAAAHSGRALAVGDQIYFGVPMEDSLIAHEVAHVAQARRGTLERAAAKSIDGGASDAAEQEADLAAQLVVQTPETPAKATPSTGTGLAESEGQRAAQLAAQAKQLQTPEKRVESIPELTPTSLANQPLREPPAPAPVAAAASKKSAYLELFAQLPSKMAEGWSAVGQKASQELRTQESAPLPKLPAKLDGGERKEKAPASAAAKEGRVEVPAGPATPELKPTPPPPAPPLPKPPEVKVASEDKNAVESAGRKVLEAIPTKDPEPPRKPGPAPVVELAGEADPVRAASAETDGLAQSQKDAAEHKERIVKGPGAAAVQPQKLDEQLSVPKLEATPELPSPPPVTEMAELRGFGLDAAAMKAFDEEARPKLDARLAQARSHIEKATEKRDRDRTDAISAAQKKTAEANREAAQKQSGEVQKARKQIVDEQKSTVQKQQKAVADLKQQSGLKRGDAMGKIDARVKADQQQIQSAYKDADQKAQEEHRKAEEEARRKKETAQQQSKDKSWWARAKAAVADAIKAVADAVCDLLAKARDAVNKLIDGVKQLACRLIDAARDFIKSAITAFGDWLKSAVTGLLGNLFPGLAARLNAFIDRAVNAAKRAVDAVADGLKKAVTALCDGLKKAVSAYIGALQSAVRAAATLATALVTGDWRLVARMVLEGILKLIGVDPKAFWALIGKAEGSLKKIIKNPRGFAGNLLGAVKAGFSLFAKNLWTHLKNGFVSWLFNTVSSAGITLPAKLDLSGIFDVTCQVLGLTREGIKKKLTKIVGEKNAERIDKIWGYVEPLVKGGIGGLWEKIKQDLSRLQEAVIGPIKTFLVEKVIQNAVIKLASLFNPAGAIAQLILTAWNLYCWLRDNLSRIMGLVQSVVDSIAEIVDGKLDKAAKLVDESLGKLVPIAIDLLARILGLGGLGEKVKGILGGIQKSIDNAIEKLLQRFIKQAGDGKDDKKDKEEGKQDTDMNREAHEVFLKPDKATGEYRMEMASANRGPIKAKMKQAMKMAATIGSAEGAEDMKRKNDRGLARGQALMIRLMELDKLIAKCEKGAKTKKGKAELSASLVKVAQELKAIGHDFQMASLEYAGEAWNTTRTMKQVTDISAFEMPKFKLMNGPPTERLRRGQAVFNDEFRRQIKLQEDGINAMTVQRWIANRDTYGKKGRSKLGEKLQEQLHKYLNDPGNGQMAALHSPDQVAGGGPDPNARGNSYINSYIGSQWPDRIGKIQTPVDELAKKAQGSRPFDLKKTRMNVKLSVTPVEKVIEDPFQPKPNTPDKDANK